MLASSVFLRNFLLKLLGVTIKEEAPVTESEINKMLTEGVAMGAYEEEEPILVENIFPSSRYERRRCHDTANTAKMD